MIENASSSPVPFPHVEGWEPTPPKFPHPSTTRVTSIPLRPSSRRSIGREATCHPGRSRRVRRTRCRKVARVPIHIRASEGEYAEAVLLPGDPLRAKYIAETYLENVEQR